MTKYLRLFAFGALLVVGGTVFPLTPRGWFLIDVIEVRTYNCLDGPVQVTYIDCESIYYLEYCWGSTPPLWSTVCL